MIAVSSEGKAVKSICCLVSCKKEVTRCEVHAYIKIAVLRRRSAMKCQSELEEAIGNSANNE